ncbi:MAG: hypothetical protein OXI53_03970 [Nitrospira sp.]|nr:hypothetical protein [Nitrospira sp.]MDE0404445.1 hypothetical protein [Nitrospira sp.]MDE0486625.1 hypothetical protein [Nitrospira sp.]
MNHIRKTSTCLGPPPLALGLALKQELYRRLAVEAMVRQGGIVRQRPVGQLPVKGREVIKQQILVVIHKGLLEKVQAQGALSYHGRVFRIGKAFRGYPVALRPTPHDGHWRVYFCHQYVADLDLHHPDP